MNTHNNLFTNSREIDEEDDYSRPIDFPDEEDQDEGNIPYNSVRNHNGQEFNLPILHEEPSKDIPGLDHNTNVTFHNRPRSANVSNSIKGIITRGIGNDAKKFGTKNNIQIDPHNLAGFS